MCLSVKTFHEPQDRFEQNSQKAVTESATSCPGWSNVQSGSGKEVTPGLQ